MLSHLPKAGRRPELRRHQKQAGGQNCDATKSRPEACKPTSQEAGRRPANDGNRVRKCADSRIVSHIQRRRRCTTATIYSPRRHEAGRRPEYEENVGRGRTTPPASFLWRGLFFTKMSMYSLLSVSLKCTFLLCGGDSYRYVRRFWPGDSTGRSSGGLVGGESTVCSS